MELNTNVVESLSDRLKIDKEVLAKVLTEKDATLPDISVTILTSEEKAQFEKNLEAQHYGRGKLAGEEVLFKKFKQAKAIEASTVDEYIANLEKSFESKYTGDSANILKEKDETISKLQKTIQETENEKNQIKTEFSQKLKETKSNTLLNSEIAKIKVEIPEQVRVLGDKAIEKYIDAKLEQHSLLFKSKFKIDFDENENPIFKDSQGNILVDKTQSPLKINEVVQMFAKDNWLDISVTSQRQGRDGQSSNRTSGDNLKGMTETELVKYCADNGILKNSKAHDEVYLKWKTANK